MKKPFWIVNKADSAAEIYLYGYIGYSDEVTASAFVKELRALEKDYNRIDLHINSGGGSVYEGLAIIAAIKSSKAKIVGYVDGIAASMAAVIALSLSECYMNEYSRMMTHRVQAGCYGNADELRAQAEQVESLENTLVDILVKKTGLEAEAVKNTYITDRDKWMTADECQKAGLVNGVVDNDVDVPQNAAPEEIFSIYDKELTNKHFPQTQETLFVL
ncbi:MAG: Clp protease ClpP [Bacteroidetes bacterium]|nr:Clp protease ClpP [Bacteroidota bacterium]